MFLDYYNIRNDLALIASLKKGFTISTSSKTIIAHNSWSTAIWRTFQGENRYDTLDFIITTLNNAVSISYPDLTSNILSALVGCDNLLITYQADKDFTTKLRAFTKEILYKIKIP